MQPSPWVLFVTGPPGSGKSTTGHELARRLPAALLDQDSMTNPLVDVVAGLLGVEDYSDPRLAREVREPRYAAMLRVARDCVSVGLSAVLVAPYTAERRDLAAWRALEAEVESHGARPALVWLRIAPDELAHRLTARGASRDTTKLRDLRQHIGTLDLDAPVGPHIAVDGALSPVDQVDAVLEALR